MADSSMRNPAAVGMGSGGLAGALVVIFNALVSQFTGHTPDPDVVAAESTVVTALVAVGWHYLTKEGLIAEGDDTPQVPGPLSPTKQQ